MLTTGMIQRSRGLQFKCLKLYNLRPELYLILVLLKQ
jgi:hypothetical protein